MVFEGISYYLDEPSLDTAVLVRVEELLERDGARQCISLRTDNIDYVITTNVRLRDSVAASQSSGAASVTPQWVLQSAASNQLLPYAHFFFFFFLHRSLVRSTFHPIPPRSFPASSAPFLASRAPTLA